MKKLLYILIVGSAFSGLYAQEIMIINQSSQDISIYLDYPKGSPLDRLSTDEGTVIKNIPPYIVWETIPSPEIPSRRLWKIDLTKENLSSADWVSIIIEDTSITGGPGTYRIHMYPDESSDLVRLYRSAKDITDEMTK